MSYAGERRLLSRFADGPLGLSSLFWICFFPFSFFINISLHDYNSTHISSVIFFFVFSCPKGKKRLTYIKGDFASSGRRRRFPKKKKKREIIHDVCFMLIWKWIKEWAEWGRKKNKFKSMSYAKTSKNHVHLYRPCALPKVIRSGFVIFIFELLFIPFQTHHKGRDDINALIGFQMAERERKKKEKKICVWRSFPIYNIYPGIFCCWLLVVLVPTLFFFTLWLVRFPLNGYIH
jgi:hypothetical protein